MNGCIDPILHDESYPQFAFNNTYGIKAINQSLFDISTHDNNRPGGCKDLTNHCRKNGSQLNAKNTGGNPNVDRICTEAYSFCEMNVIGPYLLAGRSPYDVTAPQNSPFPPQYYNGFLNQAWVQTALGVPLNYTESDSAVFAAFIMQTGDWSRGGTLSDLGSVLDSGIKVAMVYGDRDYLCNWLVGEAESLAVPHKNSK